MGFAKAIPLILLPIALMVIMNPDEKVEPVYTTKYDPEVQTPPVVDIDKLMQKKSEVEEEKPKKLVEEGPPGREKVPMDEFGKIFSFSIKDALLLVTFPFVIIGCKLFLDFLARRVQKVYRERFASGRNTKKTKK
ncbi:hypothetical protein CAEBREN_10693 [Caenorhabditis brenneri]|uniref:Uncharacterized protein n=1 Tax=Caenorhabditis brenneri TaxID=135651 RepID=G0MJC3_CAEBE|nr:hypothetical protein CAEBREN_10693 [Caenorhabditis brenneri]